MTYNANTGSCSPATRDVCLGSASAAPSCSKANHHIASYSVSGSCTGFNSSTGSCSAVNGAVTITANWAIDTRTVTFNSNGGTCDVSSRTVNHGESAAGPSCTRPEYNLTDFSITSGSCAETFDPATGSCSKVTTNITIQANWVLANRAPFAPTELLTDNSENPTKLTNSLPEFSAVFTDPDQGDNALHYQVQVFSQEDCSEPAIWDSGLESIEEVSSGSVF